MVINAALNLVFPIRWSDKQDANGYPIPLVTAYHTPISREVFEANYRVIAATQVELSGKGPIGQRIAALALNSAARQDAFDQGLTPEQIPASSPILAEIKRLTLVLAPLETGYELLPIDPAIARGVIDADDWREAEASLVFFTCALSMVPRMAKERVAQAYASVLRGSTTSLLPSEFIASLPTSTAVETSAEQAASLVPS